MSLSLKIKIKVLLGRPSHHSSAPPQAALWSVQSQSPVCQGEAVRSLQEAHWLWRTQAPMEVTSTALCFTHHNASSHLGLELASPQWHLQGRKRNG